MQGSFILPGKLLQVFFGSIVLRNGVRLCGQPDLDYRSGAGGIRISGNSVDSDRADSIESEEGDIELPSHKDEDGKFEYVR